MRIHVLLPVAGALALTSTAVRASGDDRADALINEVVKKSASVRSLTATLTMTQQEGGSSQSSTGPAKLLKPNKGLIALKGNAVTTTIASDGKTVINLMSGNRYIKMPAVPKGGNIMVGWAFPVSMFFDLKAGLASLGDGPIAYGGTETVNGIPYDVLVKTDDNSTVKLFVNPDKVVTRATIEIKQEKQVYTLGAELTNLKLNAPVTAADIAFTVPKTASLYKPPDYNSKLIPVGKLAEKFDLVALKGDHITLDDAARGKKAVLVNFWFYG